MTLLPGATLDPGAHWNYQAGRSSCLTLVQHYTVGRDSRALIRNNGLAPLLIWDDIIWEYAPLDAVCYTQCEWNRRSIGYEVESLDGTITDGQIANLAYAELFAMTTFGIPDVFYDGPRLPVGTDYRGVTNHRNLIHNACDMHSDGFDRWVWDAMHAAQPPDEGGHTEMEGILGDHGDGTSTLIVKGGGGQIYYDLSGRHSGGLLGKLPDTPYTLYAVNGAGGSRNELPIRELPMTQLLDARLAWYLALHPPAGSGGGGGGATAQEVDAIVTADGAKTRAEVAKPRPLTGSVG